MLPFGMRQSPSIPRRSASDGELLKAFLAVWGEGEKRVKGESLVLNEEFVYP